MISQSHTPTACAAALSIPHFLQHRRSLLADQGHDLYEGHDALGGAFRQGVLGRNQLMILDRRRMVAKLANVVQRLNVLVPGDWVAQVDAWRSHQPGLPNRSEAIRRLVQLALEAETKPKGKGKPKS